MKLTSKSVYLKLATIVLAVSLGLSAYAETPREELAHATRLLKKADRDYEGHRAKAVAEVEVAAHELGLDLGGEVPERERQWKSDEQLKEARRLLRHARDKMEARDRDRVAAHLEVAIKELDVALKIR